MASLTHLLYIGNVSASGATYRARTDGAATVKIEYSTASNLAGSTTSTGVSVVSGDDFTGGEAITGLSASTLYYYSILVDGVRAHSAPYPSFTTFPAQGVDATVRVVFGSCQLSATDGIFASIAAESPRLVFHIGDFGYPDSTVLATQRTNYQTQCTSDYLTHIIRKFPQDHIWDDHDFGGNNEDGDLVGKANCLQAFKEYRPTSALVNGSNGLWHVVHLANADFFVPDTRYQREGSRPRFPNSVPGTTFTADTGSTGTSLVLRSADSPSAGNNAYQTWFAKITTGSGTYYRRVSSYAGGTRTCTLDSSVPGLGSTSTYALKRASMLDMDAIASGQLAWLIAAINASTARWKFLVSSVMWNPTFTGSGSDDSWGGYDLDQMERGYLFEHITASNVIVLSGDRHHAAIDDGTHSGWPECSASPFSNTNIASGGGAVWSHGTYAAGKNYGVVDISAGSVTLTIKNAAGAEAAGITPLTVITATDPPVSDTRRISWLRA